MTSTAAQSAPDFRALLEMPISWNASDDPDTPWHTLFGSHRLAVRMNDFPDEVLYTLLIDEKDVADFDDWPALWTRPATSA